MEGKLIASFTSARAAANSTGISVTSICNNCSGKVRQAVGYIFQYADQARGAQISLPSDEPMKLYERVRAYAISLCHCKEMADDLVQEAYTLYYEKFVGGKSNAYTFLTSMVKWQFYQEAKRHHYEVDVDSLAYCLASEQEDIEEEERHKAILHTLLHEKMAGVFATIKTEKRRKKEQILFTYYLQGMSAEEIGQKMHISTPSAKQRIMKMRKFVTSTINIPLRKFTQYNCNMESAI